MYVNLIFCLEKVVNNSESYIMVLSSCVKIWAAVQVYGYDNDYVRFCHYFFLLLFFLVIYKHINYLQHTQYIS